MTAMKLWIGFTKTFLKARDLITGVEPIVANFYEVSRFSPTVKGFGELYTKSKLLLWKINIE